MILYLSNRVPMVAWILLTSVVSMTLLVLAAFATWKRRQTRRLLEKAGLPTIVWIPRFINYRLDQQRTISTDPTTTTAANADIPKKLAASNITNILPRMERLGGPYGMYGTVYGISTPVIHVAHPTPARAILMGETSGSSSPEQPNNSRLPISSTSGATKAPAYNHFKNFSGDGVFTADGDEWKEKRASVMHSLFRSSGQAFVQLLEVEANHAADVFIEQVERQRKLQENDGYEDVARVNIVPLLQRSTIGLIYRYLTHDNETARDFIEDKNDKTAASSLSEKNHSSSKKALETSPHLAGQHWTLSLDKYLDSITNIRMILLAQSRSLWYLLPRWCYRCGSPMYQEEERTLLPIREFARMACRKAKPTSPLARLMTRESHGNDKDMLDEAVTLLFAGQDTSAATLSWTIHLLSLYPDIQNKLASEVASAMLSLSSTSSSDFVPKSLFSRMPYLDAVIKEAMRLYPVAPFVVRRLSHDVPVFGGSGASKADSKHTEAIVTLPAGAVACIWIYGLHRNPTLWDQPDDFVPERWLNSTTNTEAGAASTPCQVCHEAYMPFAIGPRNCVGQPMAQVILRVLLARLVWHFQFCDERLSRVERETEVASNATISKTLQKEMQAGFTVLPLGGVQVAIHARRRTVKLHK